MSNPFLLGLRTTIYLVPDLANAKSWYAEALGIEPYFDETFYVGFDVGGYELGLLPMEGGASGGTNIRSYWGVADARAAFDRLIEAGATPHEEPTDVGDGVIVATVLDPWGNLFGVIYNPHFKGEI